MKWRHVILLLAGLGFACWAFVHRPFPLLGDDPVADLIAGYSPRFYNWMLGWYYLAPAVVVMMGGLILLSVWRVFFRASQARVIPLGNAPGLAAGRER